MPLRITTPNTQSWYQGAGCEQKNALLPVYDQQLREYLSTFQTPEDYQWELLDHSRRTPASRTQPVQRKGADVAVRLERLRKQHEWVDIDDATYLQHREEIQSSSQVTLPAPNVSNVLDKCAWASAWGVGRMGQCM